MRRTKFYRSPLYDTEGIVEVGYSPKTDIITSGYSIHRNDFDALLYGKSYSGGILIIQCGLVLPPLRSRYARPSDKVGINHLCNTVINESGVFFSELNTLSKVYDELTSKSPKFKMADPRSVQLREMHSGIVAYILNREWRHHLVSALNAKNPLLTQWINDVSARLEKAEADTFLPPTTGK